MKTKSILLTLALGAALAGFTGCKKSESESAPPDMASTNAPAASMGDQMKSAATNAVAETKEAASAAVDKTKEVAGEAADKAKEVGSEVKTGTENAVTAVKDKVEGTNQAATSTAQDLIDKAKALVADSKYKEALDTLQGLASFKLTDEQQKTVDDLKEQIQKGLSAAGVSNLLGK